MRPSRLLLRCAAAAVILAVGAGPAAAAAGWKFTKLKGGLVAEDGTQYAGAKLVAPDGTETPVPDVSRVLGLTHDGRAFLVREADVYGRTFPDGPAGEPRYTALFPNVDVGFYAWLRKGGAPVATTVGQSPAPNGGYFSGTAGDRGWFDGTTYRLLDGPTVDGYVVDLPPNPQRAYISAWYPKVMSGGGWIAGNAFDAWNWRTVVWRAQPGGAPAEVLDTVQGEAYDEDRIATPYGVADDGTVLYRVSEGGDDAVDELRVAPGGRAVATCQPNVTLPYGSIAGDGSLLAYCLAPGAPLTTFTVTGPAGSWTYRGEPILSPRVLRGGLVAGYTGSGTDLRGVLIVNGRVVDLVRTFGASSPGSLPQVASIDRKQRLLVYAVVPPGPGSTQFLAERRNVVSVDVATTGGAPAANVPVTVTEGSGALRARRVVRTGRDGVARFEASGAAVTVSIARGCLAGPRGCATSLAIPLGLLADPAPVAALAGRGAATAPIIARVAQPARLKVARGKVALPVRCLRATRCRGTAKLVLAGRRASAGSGRIGVAARKDGSVVLTLTKAAKARLAGGARAGRITLVVGGRTVVTAVRVSR